MAVESLKQSKAPACKHVICRVVLQDCDVQPSGNTTVNLGLSKIFLRPIAPTGSEPRDANGQQHMTSCGLVTSSTQKL